MQLAKKRIIDDGAIPQCKSSYLFVLRYSLKKHSCKRRRSKVYFNVILNVAEIIQILRKYEQNHQTCLNGILNAAEII